MANGNVSDNLPGWAVGLVSKRSFVYTVDAPPEAVAQALEGLAVPLDDNLMGRLFQSRLREVHLPPPGVGTDGQPFEILSQRNGEGDGITSALARGVIHGQGESSTLYGYTRYSLQFILIMMSLIAGIVVLLTLAVESGSPGMALLCTTAFHLALAGAALLWIFTSLATDRRRILQDLETALARVANAKYNKKSI